MSIDIIVNLPLETHSKEIFLFVSKLAGSEFEIKPNDGKSVVDFSKPCDKNNCWTYQIKYEIKVDDLSSAQLFFEDTLKQKHRWYFSAENESLEHKKFLMSSHALGAVIGKRLVDFFGVAYNIQIIVMIYIMNVQIQNTKKYEKIIFVMLDNAYICHYYGGKLFW